MAAADAKQLRIELRHALCETALRLQQAMRVALAHPIRLDDGRRLQFELDPFSLGVWLCATEDTVLQGERINEALGSDWYDRAEAAVVEWDRLLFEELCPWFADCWRAARGPEKFRPAFLFFHGNHLRQYDLERKQWISLAEAFGT